MSFFKKLFGGEPNNNQTSSAKETDAQETKAQETRAQETNPVTSSTEVSAQQTKPQTTEKGASGAENNQSQALSISEGDVFTNTQMQSKNEVLQFIAQKMLDNGYVSADYTEALLQREEQVSTYLVNGVAIPHGIKEAKDLVKQTGLIIVQMPQGVMWKEGSDQLVHLAVGIAANGDEHLTVLSKLTEVVMDEALSKKLGTSASGSEIIQALGMQSNQDSAQKTEMPTGIQAEIVIQDEAGMHARPATLLAKMAMQYKDTDIRLTANGRTVDVKSMAKLLTLGIRYQDEVIVSAQGPQAEQAIEEIKTALASGLDKDEADTTHANYNPLDGVSGLSDPKGQYIFSGAAASPGIAAAKVFVFKEEALQLEKNATDLAEESRQLDKALETATTQLDELYANMMEKSPTEADIFKAHQELIRDPSIINTAKELINAGNKAAWSWNRALKDQITALEALDDDRIKARTADMRDVADRVARILENKSDGFSFPQDEEFILLAKELTPSQTAFLGDAPIKGIVTELGGPNSHMAILARALGIPAIVGAGEGLVDTITTGMMSVIDPQSAQFIVSPDESTIAQTNERIKAWKGIQQVENAQKHEPAITLDGHEVEVVCNIAKPADAASVLENGGEGVGLLRTEFMFEASETEPSVEEQFNALKQIVEQLQERTLIIRTADIGGDKPVSWLNMPVEENPFLGVRGIRLSLRNEPMLRHQLTAIYKTAIWQREQNMKSGIHIMFPMIAKLSEWEKAKEIAESIRAELDAPELPLGIMIEVPSAALLADHFAKEVDFFSIGSNDMTQYTLAMDRLHPQLAAEADSYTPALLRLIDMTVKAAKENGKWVGVCGNMAADPDMAAILVGLGVTELSVSPANVPAVKFLIRSVSYEKLKNKAQKALAVGHSSEVHKLYENRDDLV